MGGGNPARTAGPMPRRSQGPCMGLSDPGWAPGPFECAQSPSSLQGGMQCVAATYGVKGLSWGGTGGSSAERGCLGGCAHPRCGAGVAHGRLRGGIGAIHVPSGRCWLPASLLPEPLGWGRILPWVRAGVSCRSLWDVGPLYGTVPPGSTNPRGARGPALWPPVRPFLTWKGSWAPGGAGKPRVCVFTVAGAGLLWNRHRSCSMGGGGGRLLPAGGKLHPESPAWGWGSTTQRAVRALLWQRGHMGQEQPPPFGVPPQRFTWLFRAHGGPGAAVGGCTGVSTGAIPGGVVCCKHDVRAPQASCSHIL